MLYRYTLTDASIGDYPLEVPVNQGSDPTLRPVTPPGVPHGVLSGEIAGADDSHPGTPADDAVQAFKRKLRSGAAVTVVNVDHPSAGLVAALGRLPVDAIFIDCEQGSADVETVEHMARAARLANRVSLVRLFTPEGWAIERYMGRGIDGIVVPRLDTAEAAAKVVAAVRYCFPAAHERKVVVVQVETRRALDELDRFLALDGIDVYFLGPVDLAKSLGYAGDHRHPDMVAKLDHALARINGAGRVAGTLVTPEDVARQIRQGARFLYTHADDFLALGARAFAATVAAAGRN